jgi:hypothetical protein
MSRALVRRKGGEGYKKYKRVVQSGGTIPLDTCVFERRTDKLYGMSSKNQDSGNAFWEREEILLFVARVMTYRGN